VVEGDAEIAPELSALLLALGEQIGAAFRDTPFAR